MNWQITNSETTLNFADQSINYRTTIGGYKRRTGIQKRYGKSGGKITGDRQVDVRDVKINFNQTAMDDQTYWQSLNTILRMFALDKGPYFIEDLDNLRRFETELEGLNDRPASEGVEYRIGDNNIDLTMLDGHWEDLDIVEYSTPSGGIATGQTFDVTNDADIECYPIITVTPSADNSEFNIINTANDTITTLASAGFVPGTQFIIDSQEGTIFLDDGISATELSSALADGTGFIFLDPGLNTIRYESLFGAVDILVQFRRRYAF